VATTSAARGPAGGDPGRHHLGGGRTGDGGAAQLAQRQLERAAVAGADLDQVRALAVLDVVVGHHRHFVGAGWAVAVGRRGRDRQAAQRWAERIGTQVPAGLGGPVAVGVTAAQPAERHRREHPRDERAADHRPRRQPDRLVARRDAVRGDLVRRRPDRWRG
jgi:hypothetical protein